MKLAWTAWASMTCIAPWGAACGEGDGTETPDLSSRPSATAAQVSAVPTTMNTGPTTMPVGELFEVRLGNQDESPNPLPVPVPAGEPITLRLLNTSPAIVHSMKLWDGNPLGSSDAILLGETGDMGPSAERDVAVVLSAGKHLLMCEYYSCGLTDSIEASAAETAGG